MSGQTDTVAEAPGEDASDLPREPDAGAGGGSGPTSPAGAGRKPSGRHAAAGVAAVAALGVVFGDIGTSPLYAFQTVFALDSRRITPVQTDVLGVLSLIVWSIVLVVTVKYVTFVMRADNDGEGGVLALAALVRRTLSSRTRQAGVLLLLGVLGASLFYGDSLITPAISVLSAFEGLEVPFPSLSHLVLPFAVVVLVVLFLVQRFGTSSVGRIFGPVMVVWFFAIGIAGIPEIARNPTVLRGLSPSYGVLLAAHRPGDAFVALGGVVLAITGCEALYADMGHFGSGPIRRAWFALVLPALLCNYLGQGGLVLRHPRDISNPFFLMMPSWAQVPMVVLAALATVIASQAVISGAYSVSHQAVRLGYLPPLRIRQTSQEEGGQIYVPAVNSLLLVGVLVLLLTFQHSAKLATAYGIAVTGTLLITTVLFLTNARAAWHWPRLLVALFAVVVGGLELLYLAANLTKVTSGGWLPLAVAVVLFTVMTTWQKGRRVVTRERMNVEGSLGSFLDGLPGSGVLRIPGTAVFPHPTKATVPLALRANVERNHVLHATTVIVTAEAQQLPRVEDGDRLVIDDLGHGSRGIWHVTVRYGFSDRLAVAAALRQASDEGLLGPDLDVAGATYFVSRATLRTGANRIRPRWRAGLFTFLAHNAADPAQVLRIPVEQTVIMGGVLDV